MKVMIQHHFGNGIKLLDTKLIVGLSQGDTTTRDV
jgi:hypothetical protein